jgi:hypothetical protein
VCQLRRRNEGTYPLPEIPPASHRRKRLAERSSAVWFTPNTPSRVARSSEGVVDARRVEGDEEEGRKRERAGESGECWVGSEGAYESRSDSCQAFTRAAEQLSENDGGKELTTPALPLPPTAASAEGLETDRDGSGKRERLYVASSQFVLCSLTFPFPSPNNPAPPPCHALCSVVGTVRSSRTNGFSL